MTLDTLPVSIDNGEGELVGRIPADQTYGTFRDAHDGAEVTVARKRDLVTIKGNDYSWTRGLALVDLAPYDAARMVDAIQQAGNDALAWREQQTS